MNLYIKHELNFYSVESVIDDEYLVRETDGYSIWQRVEARFNVKRLLNSVQDARGIIVIVLHYFSPKVVSFVVVWTKTCLREWITRVPFYQDRHLYG